MTWTPLRRCEKRRRTSVFGLTIFLSWGQWLLGSENLANGPSLFWDTPFRRAPRKKKTSCNHLKHVASTTPQRETTTIYKLRCSGVSHASGSLNFADVVVIVPFWGGFPKTTWSFPEVLGGASEISSGGKRRPNDSWPPEVSVFLE